MQTEPTTPFMVIAIAACQLGIFVIFLSVRNRFICRAEHLLLCVGILSIFFGTVTESTGHAAANLLRFMGWIAYLIGMLIQFTLRDPKEPIR